MPTASAPSSLTFQRAIAKQFTLQARRKPLFEPYSDRIEKARSEFRWVKVPIGFSSPKINLGRFRPYFRAGYPIELSLI